MGADRNTGSSSMTGGKSKRRVGKAIASQSKIKVNKNKSKSSSSSSKSNKNESKKKKGKKVEFNHEERKQHRLLTAAERPKLDPGDVVFGMIMKFEVLSLLGSGGFGDVYKVKPSDCDNPPFESAAMKTELLDDGNHPMMNRLKIELDILRQFETLAPEKKIHFTEMYDRGKTPSFKFIVMELVGKSIYAIQKDAPKRELSVSTALKLGMQTLTSIEHLHDLGYLHRDIKPHNYSIGLGNKRNKIYMLDFGIARRFVKKTGSRVLRVPRETVKFLGTLKYASRCCHYSREQARKDDLESWLFMQLEFLDHQSLFWAIERDRKQVVNHKEKLFAGECGKKTDHIPGEILKIMNYIDGLTYTASPDYAYMRAMIACAAKTAECELSEPFDWEEGAKNNMKRYKKKKSWFFGGDDKKKKAKPKDDFKSHKDGGISNKDSTDTKKDTDKNEESKNVDKENESNND